MKINFFEEFPTGENLEKVKLIKFNSVVYVAAASLKDFSLITKEIKKLNKKITPAYWPTLKKEEGYWLSPFSKNEALERVFNEIKENKKKLTVLLDLELPLRHPARLVQGILSFFRNKKLIKNFLESKPENLTLVTAEYPLKSFLSDSFLSWLGVRFLSGKINERIFMCYTSMANSRLVREDLHQVIKKQKSVGLGTIAKGILGFEPVLPAEELEKDLFLAKKSGVKTATIFRLGGLNKDYLKVINNFKSN